jgi:hypothetical protein
VLVSSSRFGSNFQTSLAEEQDIDDPSAYSIEQSKQKSEHDKMMSNAEAKKQDMRKKINELRAKYKELTSKNEQLPLQIQMKKDVRNHCFRGNLSVFEMTESIFHLKEFVFEESVKNQVLHQINERIKLTHRELAWYSEKCRLSLEKVKSR